MDLLESTANEIFGASGDVWAALEEAGLTLIGVAEEAGGSGGDLGQLATVLRTGAYHAAPLPLAETWLAAWLLATAGLPIPAGPLTAATGDVVREGTVLTGELRRVGWASEAAAIVVLGEGFVGVLDPGRLDITPGRNIAGEPRDDVHLDGVTVERVGVVIDLRNEYRSRAALARATQMAGAARRALDLSVRYANERVQFGRPIGRFQAVQQQLAELAGEAVLLDVGARAAVAEWCRHPDTVPEQAIAAVRVAAERSAGTVAAIAHQIHGAIGVTGEHELHTVTLRLNAWREECPAELTIDDPWRFIVNG